MKLKIEKLIPPFKGLSHLPDGKAVMLDYVLDGELVEAEIISDKKRYATASCADVIERSKYRIEPCCRHFGQCGGCSLLYMSYEKECLEKERLLADRLSCFEGVCFEPAVFKGRDGMRTKAVFHVAAGQKGFYKKFSHDVVDIGFCPLLCKKLNDRLNALSSDGISADYSEMIDNDKITVCGLAYNVSNKVFFQSNVTMAAELLRYVKERVMSSHSVLDLYAGVGFFSKAVEQTAGSVTAVEGNKLAASLARMNLQHTHFLNMDVENCWKYIKSRHYDAVIVDPPRGGMSVRAMEVLKKVSARTVVYVSCDIGVSVNDIKELCHCGYRLASAKLFDMYPATEYIEVVSVLTRQY